MAAEAIGQVTTLTPGNAHAAIWKIARPMEGGEIALAAGSRNASRQRYWKRTRAAQPASDFIMRVRS